MLLHWSQNTEELSKSTGGQIQDGGRCAN